MDFLRVQKYPPITTHVSRGSPEDVYFVQLKIFIVEIEISQLSYPHLNYFQLKLSVESSSPSRSASSSWPPSCRITSTTPTPVWPPCRPCSVWEELKSTVLVVVAVLNQTIPSGNRYLQTQRELSVLREIIEIFELSKKSMLNIP